MSRRRITRYRESTIIMSDCKSLILVDAEPIKRAEQKKCKDVIHQMDLARERLRRFNEESEPAFRQWLHSTFGKEITELRELAQKRSDLYRLLHEVEDYKYYARCSYHQAYKSVIDRMNQKDVASQETERSEDPFCDDGEESDADDFHASENSENESAFRATFESLFGPRNQWRGSKSEYDAAYEDFKESFETIFGDEIFGHEETKRAGAANRGRSHEGHEGNDGRDFKQNLGDFDELHRQSERELESQDSRLKNLYRTLARKLHPDVNVELDHKRKDLWHQVQAAYDAKDIERLETLSAMSELFDDNARSVESVWSLKSLYEELRSGLRHLQRQINRCNKDIAWSFEKTKKQSKKLEGLHKKMASLLKADKGELLDHIEQGERQIERWKNPPSPRKPRSRSNRPHKSRPVRDHHRQPQWTKAEMDAFTGFGTEED
jgi:hypothetical protein